MNNFYAYIRNKIVENLKTITPYTNEMNKYIFTLALIQVVAMAQNDFDIDDDDYMEADDLTSRSLASC